MFLNSLIAYPMVMTMLIGGDSQVLISLHLHLIGDIILNDMYRSLNTPYMFTENKIHKLAS
jgi:hypothetical protein